jgi:hypothetical protein
MRATPTGAFLRMTRDAGLTADIVGGAGRIPRGIRRSFLPICAVGGLRRLGRRPALGSSLATKGCNQDDEEQTKRHSGSPTPLRRALAGSVDQEAAHRRTFAQRLPPRNERGALIEYLA